MSTNWTSPSILEQYAEDESHITWNSADVSLILSGTSISTSSPLLHIARQPRNDIKMKTYFLRASGFNFEKNFALLFVLLVSIRYRPGSLKKY